VALFEVLERTHKPGRRERSWTICSGCAPPATSLEGEPSLKLVLVRVSPSLQVASEHQPLPDQVPVTAYRLDSPPQSDSALPGPGRTATLASSSPPAGPTLARRCSAVASSLNPHQNDYNDPQTPR